MKKITTEQLKSFKETNRDFLLVNTLDPEHFDKTRIADAVNIPQSQDDFAEQVAQVTTSKQRPVVVYCASEECDSSTKAAEKLEAAGFSDVYDYEGGARAWQEAGEQVDA
jgi:rhodanese-related sulfurtransferase